MRMLIAVFFLLRAVVAFAGDGTLLTGGPLDFSGKDTPLMLPARPPFRGDFSFALWVCPGSTPEGRQFYLINRHGYDIALNFNKRNRYDFNFWNSTKSVVHRIESPAVSPTDWHYVVGIYAAAEKTMRLFIDGKCVAEKVIPDDCIRLGSQFYIGRREQLQPGTEFKGKIGRYVIVEKAMSADEVRQTYEAEKSAYPAPDAPIPSAEVKGILPAYAEADISEERKAATVAALSGYRRKIAELQKEFEILFAGYEKTLQAERIAKRMEIVVNLFGFIEDNMRKNTVSGWLFAESGVDDLRHFHRYFEQEREAWRDFPKSDGVNVFNLLDFGAKGDGVSSDSAAFYAAFDAIRKLDGKPSVLKIPAGTYLLTEKRVMPPFKSIHTGELIEDKNLLHAQLAVYDLRNCLIEGEPGEKSRIVFGVYDSQGIRLINCFNTTLRNLHLNWQVAPFCQGTVLEVDGAAGTAVIRQDPGTLRPDDPRYKNHKQMLVCTQFTPEGKIYTPASFMFYDRKAEDLGDGKFRVQMDTSRPYYTHGKMKVGYKLVIPDRNNFFHAASLCYTAFCNMENISIRNSRAASFSSHCSIAPSFFHCRIYPMPGMVLSSNADGLICGPGTYMADCDFRNMSDDGFNSHVRGNLITRAENNRTIINRQLNLPSPGDLARIVAPETGQYIAQLHVRRSTQLQGSAARTEFVESLPDGLKSYDSLGMSAFTEEQRKLITHNLMTVRQEPDHVYFPNECGTGSVVSNCSFRNIRGSGVVIQGANMIVENNTLDSINWQGIRLGALLKYQEGPPPYNCVIRNNKLSNVVHGLMGNYQVQNSQPALTAPIAGVRYENNELSGISGNMVDFQNMADVAVSGLRLTGENGMLRIFRSEDISFSDCRINGNPLEPSQLRQAESRQITVK